MSLQQARTGDSQAVTSMGGGGVAQQPPTDEAIAASGTGGGGSVQRPWLPIFAIVSLLAVLGGAGAVLLSPSEQTYESGGPASGARIQRVLCEKMVGPKVFNLRSSRGARIAKVAFRFEYRTLPMRQQLVAKTVMERWGSMESEVLKSLMERTAFELTSETGMQRLEEDLRNDINESLFRPRPGAALMAEVDDILWVELLVQ